MSWRVRGYNNCHGSEFLFIIIVERKLKNELKEKLNDTISQKDLQDDTIAGK